jgi:hypothetical protein
VISNLSLFSFAILKTLLGTVGPGLILAGIFEKCPFPFCVRREFHREGHAVRIPVERLEPEQFSQVPGERLADISVLIPVDGIGSPATSSPRKVSARRTA